MESAPDRKSDEPQTRALMVCLACECITFLLDGDGVIECANCGNPILNDDVDWARQSKGVADPVKEDVEGQVNVVEFFSAHVGYRRFLDAVDVQRDPLVVVVYPSGQVRTWGPQRDDEPYREWLKRRFVTALDILTGKARGA